MIRILAQIMIGLMLVFGTFTLIPRGMLLLKAERIGRGILSIILGIVCTFFSLMCFYYAYLLIRGIS